MEVAKPRLSGGGVQRNARVLLPAPHSRSTRSAPPHQSTPASRRLRSPKQTNPQRGTGPLLHEYLASKIRRRGVPNWAARAPPARYIAAPPLVFRFDGRRKREAARVPLTA
ncbi:hypothetical protein PR202_gb12245 [Eleusine coracana subsp. coracana]|uniref:Uncharacterized protein n=1 Tax=Eleusine coracana subsp. coracana TaxID=191504 RepID=A0AAV5EPZ9_ELECO|nr:hypothetical protein PR202_gb12245 [Eleusine coracana subsp. coracana]